MKEKIRAGTKKRGWQDSFRLKTLAANSEFSVMWIPIY